MKFSNIVLLFILISFSLQVSAREFSSFARVGLVSHFIFRGNDFNNNSPVVQADYILVSDSGWWLGAFASNWTFQDKTEIEFDLMTGYDFQLAEDLVIKTGVVRYLFPDVGGHSTEWSLGLNFKDWTVKHHYDQHLDSRYSELNYAYKLNNETEVLLHFGTFSNENLSSENDYEIKVAYQFKENTQFFAAFSKSDLDKNYLYGGAYFSF